MGHSDDAVAEQTNVQYPTDDTNRRAIVAAGGVLGAVLASSCCIVPLALFGLGIGGAWIGNLAVLAPYQPIIVGVTLGILGYGHYLVYRKPRIACANGAYCAGGASNRVVKGTLWTATVLVAAAVALPFAAPLLLTYE